jgi:signal recognition particle GTPase
MLRPLKGRPAAVLLMASCTFLAAVVEQLHADVFPDGVRAVEAHSIDRLDLDDAVTPAAAHAQDMPGYFR